MNELIVNGRPDFDDHSFGKTHLKNFPKYVYGTSHQAMLVHKVSYVEAHWYRADYSRLVRLQTPKLIANCVCGQSFFIHLPDERRHFRATLCEVPNPDAVLCGRCHGEVATFGKHGKPPCTKEAAKVRLGCIARGKDVARPYPLVARGEKQ